MALFKFGSIHKLAKAAAADVTLAIDKVIETKKEGCVYFRARAISAGDQGPKGVKWNYNGNLDYFAKKELLRAFPTFVGRNLFLNHDTSNPLKAVGKVLDSYPVEDPETGEFYIECLSRIDKNLHPELAGMIENGDLNSVSMGASCGASMCSVCGHTIHSDQDTKCGHLNRLGQQFDAEVDLPEFHIKKGESVPAFCINSDLTFSELSIVSVPADSAALIKTVIAAFQDRLHKTASKEPSVSQSIVAELDTLLSLLSEPDREAVKQQICASVGSCAPKVGKIADLQKEAAAYDVLVHALSMSDDATMASLDLFRAMVDAGFSPGRSKDGKQERQIFYNALHSAINKGWARQVEPGVYALTDEGKKRAEQLREWMGEDTWPGKGKMGPKAPAKEEAPEQPTAPDQKDMVDADNGQSSGEHTAPEEKMPTQKPIWAQRPDNTAATQPNLEAKATNSPEILDILKKLSGLEYERLQEHMTHKIKSRDISMDNAQAEVKPQDLAAKSDEMKMDEPMNAAPALEKAPESQEAKEEKKDVDQLQEAEKHLDEAKKLVKEVKEHEKKELQELKKDEPKEEKAPEAMEPMAAKKPALSAKFSKKPFLSQSIWTVFADEKPILTATLRDICGEHLPEMRSLVTSEEYGNRLIARIQADGLERVASLLNVKASDEAMEHLRGKEWNDAAHQKGFSEVRKMQEGAESQADKSKKDVERPYGEPGDHLKAQAQETPKVSKEAATEKKAAEEGGFSPAAKDHSKEYEKGGVEVVKAHEANERDAASSRKAIDRPYGEPGDHLKAQASKEAKAAQEGGFSPAPKDHQKDYEKGQEDVRKGQEAVQKEVNKDTPEHMRVKTSYEAGEHLVAKKAGACPCGKPECACECMMGKECSCSMGAMAAQAAKTVKAGKVEPLSSPSPETLAKADKMAGEVSPPGPSAPGSQNWDKNKDLFKSDKVPSDEAKMAEVGKQAHLEKGEQTLSEATEEKAHPAGGAREDLMKPTPEAEAEKAVGGKEKAADISKDAKLEPGEQTLSDATKESMGADDLKPRMGSEKDIPSDEAKAKAIGREAALDDQIKEAQAHIKQLEADLASKSTQLAQEKLERGLEAKMQKCRKLVEEMVKKDLLAENQEMVEKYMKQGQSLLDARKSAIKETVDMQLAAFMQMPDSLLKVQAETISRMKKIAAPASNTLRIPIQGGFDHDASETAWMDSLPWS